MSKLVDWFKWKLTGHLHISQDKPLGFGWYSSNLNQSNDKFLFEAESCELAIQRELEQTGQIFRVLAVFYYIIYCGAIHERGIPLDTFWIFLTLFESFWSFWHIILTLQQCAQAHEAPWVAHDRNSCGQAIQMTWTSSSASAADQWHTAAAWWTKINIHILIYIRIYIYIHDIYNYIYIIIYIIYKSDTGYGQLLTDWNHWEPPAQKSAQVCTSLDRKCLALARNSW